LSDPSGGRHKHVTATAHNSDMARPTSSEAVSWRHVPRPVLVVALVTAVCLLGDSALYVLLPSHLDAFAVSPTGAGLILGINRYIRIASNSGAGWLFERVGIRVPLLFAVLLAAATTAAYGLFSGFWPLFVAHGLWGIAWSILRLGGYLVVVDAAHGVALGRLMGVLQGVSRGGSLVAVIVGGLLADLIGGREALVLFGVITLSALAALPFGRIPPHLGKKLEPPAGASGSGGEQAIVQQETRRKLRVLYGQAVIAWLLIPGLFVSTAGYLVRTVAGDGATLYGVVLGVGLLSGILVAVRWVGDLGLGPYFGHLSDRLGRPRVILTAMGAMSAAMLTVALSPTLPVTMAMFSVIFVGSTALMISLNASAAELAPPERRAMVLSRYATWADIGSGTGPLVGLSLVASVGFGWAYGGGAVLMAAAAIWYWSVFARGRG